MNEFKFKREIIKIIEIYFPNAKIYLFGSYARGDNRPGSDLDIAIDAGRPLTLQEIANPKRLIEALPMAQTVDVVCLHSIPAEMRSAILKEGILWKN